MDTLARHPRNAAAAFGPRPSRLEPDPLPLPDVGRPPRHRLCREGTPPIGLEFLGAKATLGGYLMPCPCCVQGWCLLVPDGEPYGYASASSTAARAAARVPTSPGGTPGAAWTCRRSPPSSPDEKGRRYAVAAVRNEMRQLLERRPADPVRGLSSVAFKAGQFMAATGFDQDDHPRRPAARRRRPGRRARGRQDTARPGARRRSGQAAERAGMKKKPANVVDFGLANVAREAGVPVPADGRAGASSRSSGPTTSSSTSTSPA